MKILLEVDAEDNDEDRMSAAMTADNMVLNLFNVGSSVRAVTVCPPGINETVDVKAD